MTAIAIRRELIPTREAAARLSIHPETLRRLVRDGQVPAVRLRERGWLRFNVRDLERLIEGR
jgi:excisionase family DNA binding protein